MIAYRVGFEFGGVYCYPAGEEDTFFFLPLAPRPETDANGDPTLMSIPMGGGGFLQLGARLEAGQETLAALRRKLAQRLGLEEPEGVRLRMAPLTVEGVALLVGKGDGALEQVARSSTSGFPPYTALFHLQLDAAQHNAVAAALNGRAGFVQVRYDVSLPQAITVRARLVGDAQSLIARLATAPAGADLETAACQLLEDALAEGQFALEVEAPDAAPPELVERATARAREKAVDLLLHRHGGGATAPDEATVLAAVELAEEVSQPLQLTTDVADWFAPGNGTQHLLIPPGTAGP
jgi:hypothetical protein